VVYLNNKNEQKSVETHSQGLYFVAFYCPW
jgi:hypothetical protein